MSALCHKQTFMPYSTYLVGELLHGQRNIQAERLRGLEIRRRAVRQQFRMRGTNSLTVVQATSDIAATPD